jgi:hypothetical protein
MSDMRRFVESRLTELRALFGAEAVTIRAEISKHVQKITLTPEGRSYVASGTWNVLGVNPWMVPGARFAPCSPVIPFQIEAPHNGRSPYLAGAQLVLPGRKELNLPQGVMPERLELAQERQSRQADGAQ